MTNVVVSIINYKTPGMTIDAATSVLDDIGDLDVHVVIVDNGSADGSDRELLKWKAGLPADAPVTIVLSPENTGFSGGHNQGMAERNADFYLVQNSDSFIRPGFLKAILVSAQCHPKAGIIAPRIEHEDGVQQHNCFRFHSPGSEFLRAADIGILIRWLRRWFISLGDDPNPDEIEWVSFASVLLRHDMVDKIGPMDEGYFLYFEDTDYCLTAGRAGWGITFCPDAKTVHFRGGSGPVKANLKTNKELPAYYYRSRSRFLYKAHGRFGLLAANMSYYFGRGLNHLSRLLGKRFTPMPEREARNIWQNFWTPLRPDERPAQRKDQTP